MFKTVDTHLLLFSSSLFRDKKEKEDNIVEEEPISTGLDVFTQNLEPEIAQNVKESWHMPQTLSVNHRLGNGKYNYQTY